jgi:cytochrome c-type biogenesis protein
MDIVLAYVAGLLTLINPCILPVLPLVLAASLQTGRQGPLLLAAGLGVSFVTLGLGLAVFGRAIGLTPEELARVGALMMAAFGAVLLIPRLSAGFATATAGLAARADARIDRLESGTDRGTFLGGLLLGAVWVPCVGPTLGGAIALASAGESLIYAAAVMAAFAAGTGTVIVALGYGAQSALRTRRDWLRGIAPKARPVMGALFLVTGLALFFELHKVAEIWLIQTLPYWLQDLSVRF